MSETKTQTAEEWQREWEAAEGKITPCRQVILISDLKQAEIDRDKTHAVPRDQEKGRLLMTDNLRERVEAEIASICWPGYSWPGGFTDHMKHAIAEGADRIISLLAPREEEPGLLKRLADALDSEHESREMVLGRGHREPCKICSLIVEVRETAARPVEAKAEGGERVGWTWTVNGSRFYGETDPSNKSWESEIATGTMTRPVPVYARPAPADALLKALKEIRQLCDSVGGEPTEAEYSDAIDSIDGIAERAMSAAQREGTDPA